MTTLQNLVKTPLAKALGWTLFHSLWEGAIVAAVLFAGLFAIRSARIRYIAACVAMLAILAGFAFTLARLLPEKTAFGAAIARGLPPAAEWDMTGCRKCPRVFAWRMCCRGLPRFG